MKNNPFSFFRDQVEAHIPETLRPLNDEIKNTTRKIIHEKLAEFDLVPREEFEQQQRLLAQAEQRIAALEQQINALQNKQQSSD